MLPSETPPAPTLKIGASRKGPLLVAIISAIVASILLYERRRLGIAVVPVATVACLGFIFALRQLLIYRPRIIISSTGIELTERDTGLLRWHELVHVEASLVQGVGCVTIFVSDDAAARLPRDRHGGGFVFAHLAAPGQHHLWITDSGLAYTARDIAAEINARRNGAAGPLTARLPRSRR